MAFKAKYRISISVVALRVNIESDGKFASSGVDLFDFRGKFLLGLHITSA